MEVELFFAGTTHLLLNLTYSFISLIIAIELLAFIDRNIFTKMDIQKEIHDGNIAVAVFSSIIILFVGAIIGASMQIPI